MYVNKLSNNYSKQPKRFWNFVKQNRSNQSGIGTLKYKGYLYSTDEDKAEVLSKQFQSVFIQDEPEILQKTKYVSSNSGSNTQCENYISDIYISPTDVYKQLRQLDPNKSTGPDNICARVLKAAASELSVSVAHLFQMSMSQQKLPSDWTVSRVVPLYKKGSKADPANYRPVSLTSVLSKVLERIINARVRDFLNSNNVIIDGQHVFRNGRSCETQLLETIKDWCEVLDTGNTLDMAFLDISHAFDTVSHSILLHKLSKIGIKGSLFRWIKSFLTKRRQRVRVNSCLSDWVTVGSGVPQGTILGTTLFLLYINDITSNNKSDCKLYADDCVLYRVIKNDNDRLTFQDDLNKLCQRSDEWKLKFNISKCKIMHLGLKHMSCDYSYYMYGKELSITKEEKYLGVIITNNLSWSSHVNSLASDASRKLGIIARVFNKCNRQVKCNLYKQIILSKLDYCSNVWDPHCVGHIKVLEKVQKRAARVVLGKWDIDYKLVLNELKWLSLHKRRTYLRNLTCYKIINNLIDLPFENCFMLRQGRHLRYCHSHTLQVKFARTEYASFHFSSVQFIIGIGYM